MRPPFPRAALVSFLLLLLDRSAATAAPATRNVILITFDGARTEEIFGGADRIVLEAEAAEKEKKVEETALYRKFWAPSARERREKLMPFFWKTLMVEHGSIAGNRQLGSTARLTNKHRFSYPGYSEMLTGVARDEEVKSNDKIQNARPTVLEFLRKELGLDSRQVAVFACWDVFDWIVEHEKGAISCNSGFEAYEHEDPTIQLLSRLQRHTVTPWDTVRHDIYTLRFAMAHLATYEPRVLYIALGETDDWSHDGRYDRVLDALARDDEYLRELWTYLQSSETYRDKTSILITTDHGRGLTAKDWTDHGEKVEGAQYVWMAVVSPDCPLRGEWSDAPEVTTSQVAATLCRFLEIDHRRYDPAAAAPIERIFAPR